nr:DUF2589 domain-containing protein [uncultured Pseudomonas sp.]
MLCSDLRDITRGLQEAAAATNSLIAQQYITLFDQFFDHDPDALGAPMKAKMVEVAVDDQHMIRVPLITLVAPKGLALERMQVDLSVRVKNTEINNSLVDAGDPQPSARFKVSIGAQARHGDGRDPDEVQIRMQFQACEPPEALNRLIEQYTNLIMPTLRSNPQPPAADSNEYVEAASLR